MHTPYLGGLIPDDLVGKPDAEPRSRRGDLASAQDQQHLDRVPHRLHAGVLSLG